MTTVYLSYDCEPIWNYEFCLWMRELFKFFKSEIKELELTDAAIRQMWEDFLNANSGEEFFLSQNFIVCSTHASILQILDFRELPSHVHEFFKAIFKAESLETLNEKFSSIIRRSTLIGLEFDELETMMKETMVRKIQNM